MNKLAVVLAVLTLIGVVSLVTDNRELRNQLSLSARMIAASNQLACAK